MLVGPGGPAPALLTLIALPITGLAIYLILRRADLRQRQGAAAGTALALITVLVPAMLAAIHIGFYNPRYSAPALVPVVIAGGSGFAAARSPRLGAAALVGFAALWLAIFGLIVANPIYQNADWRGASEALGVSPSKRLVMVNGISLKVIKLYRPDATVNYGARVRVQEIDVVAPPKEAAGVAGSVPHPDGRPPAPRFSLVDRGGGDSYLVLRYRSRVPRIVRIGALHNPMGDASIADLPNPPDRSYRTMLEPRGAGFGEPG
jgi:hypothetical protein